jgi:hypothetical protein
MGWVSRSVALLLLATSAFAGTPGTFRGVMYPGRDTKPGWVYIVGRNDALRLVHIANAVVSYADEFPEERRRPVPAKDLKPGAEVRVTAEQDSNGEWRASEVEIIRAGTKSSTRRVPRGSE